MEPVFKGYCLVEKSTGRPFARMGGCCHTYRTEAAARVRLAHENRMWERFSLGQVKVYLMEENGKEE